MSALPLLGRPLLLSSLPTLPDWSSNDSMAVVVSCAAMMKCFQWSNVSSQTLEVSKEMKSFFYFTIHPLLSTRGRQQMVEGDMETSVQILLQ